MKAVKGTLIILGCILMILGSHLTSFASRATQDSLRCPGSTRVIYIGDTDSEVLAKCGEPSSIQRKRSLRTFFYRDPVEMGHEEYRRYLTDEGVYNEVWTYNFGRTKFIYYLTFQSGELMRIESGGYGY